MASRREVRENRRAFKKASRAAKQAGESVVGILHDGRPVYFTAPRDASNEEISELAFRAVNGRPRNGAERQLGYMAKAQA